MNQPTSTPAKTIKQVLKAIGCAKLDLVKCSGYLYFAYDDEVAGIYETHSVYTCYLSNLPVETWVEEAKDFLNKLRGMYPGKVA